MEIGLSAKETPHSLEAGGAVTLSTGGVRIEEVMATVKLRTKVTVSYYLPRKKVMLNNTGETLENLEKSAWVYDDIHNFKRFCQTFSLIWSTN